MKNLKKMTCLILALIMSLALAACGSSGSANDNPYGLVTPGKLTVALSPDFSPMEFVDTSKTGQDQYVGFDVTMAKYFADEMGLELVITPMSFDACQAAVQTGSVDMAISGFSWTADREENYNLSDFYIAGDNETEQALITLKEHEGEWTQASDFSGKKVGAQVASLQMNLCNEQMPEDCEIVTFTDLGTAVEALRTGNIDALAVAKGNGSAIIANNDAIAFTGFEFVIDEKSAYNLVLLKKGTDDLTAKVNELIAKSHGEGLNVQWYEEAKTLAGIDTAAEVSYDDEGNVVKD